MDRNKLIRSRELKSFECEDPGMVQKIHHGQSKGQKRGLKPTMMDVQRRPMVVARNPLG